MEEQKARLVKFSVKMGMSGVAGFSARYFTKTVLNSIVPPVCGPVGRVACAVGVEAISDVVFTAAAKEVASTFDAVDYAIQYAKYQINESIKEES